VDIKYENIILPDGREYNGRAEAVNKAAQEYDERLRFGFNEANQDWVMYIKMPRDFDSYYRIDGDPVYPVLGFGSEIPSPDTAVKRLYEADTLRQGHEFLDKMNRKNKDLEESRMADKYEEESEVYERMERQLVKAGIPGTVKVFFASKRG
jgi:hypothetical protein